MNSRTARLRQESLDAAPSLSPERASLMTDFYQANEGKYSRAGDARPARSTTSASRRRSIWARTS